MVQVGCHGSVWSGQFDEAGFRRAVEGSKEAGYDLVEIPLLDPYSFDVVSGRKIIIESGLAINASLGLTEGTDISSEREEAGRAGEALLMKALEVLHELEANFLVGVVYGALKKHMQPATETGRCNGQEIIRRVATRAQELGLKVGLEVVNRYETNIFNTAKQAMAYISALDHDNVYLHLDTYHMNIEEPDMLAPVFTARDRLGYVHIGESHRGYLGSGSVDFDTFFRALAMIGYDGPMVFESFSSAVVDPMLSNMLGVWRNLWNDPADLSTHANTFIRNRLRAIETAEMH